MEEIELPWTKENLFTAAAAHFAGIFGATISEAAAEHRDLPTDYAVRFANTLQSLGPTLPYHRGLRVDAILQRQQA